MGTRTAAPDDLAPLGMVCCGRRGAWTDIETYRRSSPKRHPVTHLGVDPVARDPRAGGPVRRFSFDFTSRNDQ